jgi:hypothetical protein
VPQLVDIHGSEHGATTIMIEARARKEDADDRTDGQS